MFLTKRLRQALGAVIVTLSLCTIFIWTVIYPQVSNQWEFTYGVVLGIILTIKVATIIVLVNSQDHPEEAQATVTSG